MTAITHILGTGYRCTRCGEQIPPNPDQKWQIGSSIGVLQSKWSNPVSYAVGAHDSNEKCIPSVSSQMSSTPSTNSDTPSTTNASDAG